MSSGEGGIFRISVGEWQSDVAVGKPYTRELDTDFVIPVVYGVDEESRPFLGILTQRRPRRVEVSSAIRVDIGRREGLDRLWTLRLTLLDIQLCEVFVLMGDSLSDAVARSSSESEGIGRVYDLVGKWQSLLRGRVGVSSKVLRGLAAELETIVELSSHGCLGLTQVLSAWGGPFGALHDFELPASSSLEVKALRANAARISISSPGQLAMGDAPLLLTTLQIEEFPEDAARSRPGVKSLGDVVARLEAEARAVPNGIRLVWDAMQELGLSANMPDLQHFFYTTGRRRWYQVSPGFPRIDLKDVPLGVENLTFQILIAAIADFEVSAEAAIDVLCHNRSGGEPCAK